MSLKVKLYVCMCVCVSWHTQDELNNIQNNERENPHDHKYPEARLRIGNMY